MPKAALNDGVDKHTRHRMNQKKRGLKLVRMWLPDTSTPEFRAEAKRQAALIRGTPEDVEAMDFIEAAADIDDSWNAVARET
jgi:hypothetical protein